MDISNWMQSMRCLRWWRNSNFSWFQLRHWVWTPAVLYTLFLGTLHAPSPAEPLVGSEAGGDGPAILLAVGDIANCNYPHHRATAALVDKLPGTIAMLGDAVYRGGTYAYFAECYDSAWGRHKARTRPVPGNHEYDDHGAAGYFQYFGRLATPLEPDCVIHCKGYYSYELGGWHIVALNSELNMVAGSEQERWLRADLANNRAKCTLAYWHRPYLSSGDHGNDERFMDIWRLLYAYGVDVVLNGHEHSYERFAPQNHHGGLDHKRGIRQFVVGTGGVPFRKIDEPRKNSEIHNHRVWGVLQLTLHKEHYEWEFKPVTGQTFEDSGRGSCVKLDRDWNLRHYLPSIR